VRLLDRMLTDAAFTAVATHDGSMIERTIASGGEKTRFQFQMLYGVRSQLQLDLVARGYDVLVATPFGPEWYPYLMRRLGERPANLLFFARSVFR
jgi:proline dehydrogenase